MGYSSLDNWVDVDGASDLRSDLIEYRGTNKFSSVLSKAILEKGNAYNPDGCVNIALLIESEEIFPTEVGKRNLFVLIDKMIQLLEQVNDDYHDMAYIRLYNVLRHSVLRLK